MERVLSLEPNAFVGVEVFNIALIQLPAAETALQAHRAMQLLMES